VRAAVPGWISDRTSKHRRISANSAEPRPPERRKALGARPKLRVPCAKFIGELLLLNPAPLAFTVLKIGEPQPFTFDGRTVAGYATRCPKRRAARLRAHCGRCRGAAAGHPVDDGAVIVLVAPNKREELGGEDVVLLEKFPIAAAAKHQ
jgi:hypothetical protein